MTDGPPPRTAAPSPTALVVGGGVVGLSSALALARDGWRVGVLDAAPALPNPRGASHDRHRLIRHPYGALVGYMRMVPDAYAAWEALFEEGGERPYAETGTLALADAPSAWLDDSRAALRGSGLAHEDLDAAGIAARAPALATEGLADALYLPTGGALLADRVLALLLRALAARGVPVRAGARVAGVEPERGEVRLADGGGTLAADLVVVAAGPWTARLLPGLAPRAVPSRQVLVNLEPPPALAAAWAASPMVIDLSESGGFYAVPPVAGTPLKVGDHRFSLRGDAEDDPREATAAEAEALLAFARPRLLDAESYRVLGARACYYDVSPGERFALEPLGPRAVALCGTSGHGFKFAPLLGAAIAAGAADASLWPALSAWAAGRAGSPFRRAGAAATPVR